MSGSFYGQGPARGHGGGGGRTQPDGAHEAQRQQRLGRDASHGRAAAAGDGAPRPNMQLNREIVALGSAAEVLAFVQDRAGEFEEIHFVTAAHRIAKSGGARSLNASQQAEL